MYRYGNYDASTLIASLGIGLFAFMVIISLAIAVFTCVVKWRVFEKAGKPGWAAIIPVYSTLVGLDIIGYNWYYIFIFCLGGFPYIGSLIILLFGITYNIKLAKAFGKDTGFGIGLLFLAPVFLAILAFDNTVTYKGKTVKGNIDFNDMF